ncbi:hypothetical protein BANRA_04016 [Acinetobacter baumannii]|nr:hypothetical protein BANRA_03084 [Acinetobacter baumannii]VCX50116.1 hypothetical protein BANRA_04016 [Acinetobacter baumannii]
MENGTLHIKNVIEKALEDGVIDWQNFKIHSQLETFEHYEEYEEIDLTDQK